MRTTVEHREDGSIVRASGRITIDTTPELRTLLLGCIHAAESGSLTLDLHEVAYMDTSGLAVLLETLKAARRRGRPFRVSRLRDRPRYLLESMRVLRLFPEVE